jgi:hypothetical protein
MALASLALLPFYLLRWMGAGDVKLAAAIGMWLGAAHAGEAWLISVLLAVAWGLGLVWVRSGAACRPVPAPYAAPAAGALRHGAEPGRSGHLVAAPLNCTRSQHPMPQLPATHRNPNRQRGVAALELALVFPVLFLMMYGLLSYGLIFAAQHSLAQSAAEGARAALRFDSLNDAEASARPRPAPWPSRACAGWNRSADVPLPARRSW